jgi:hypothetical protein
VHRRSGAAQLFELQHGIGQVAVGIVDFLKIVHVEQDGLTDLLRSARATRGRGFTIAAVEQAGERVMDRLFLELILQGADFGDLLFICQLAFASPSRGLGPRASTRKPAALRSRLAGVLFQRLARLAQFSTMRLKASANRP